MLHVAYDRLSISEQYKLNSELLAAFANVKNDRIRQLVESYRQRDLQVVNTELHSILGTEERDLTPSLERHYTKYFTKRSTVVGLSEQYENVFTSLRARARTIETQLKTLKDNITFSQSQLEQQAESIKSERRSIESLQQSSPGDYRGRIDSYNARVDSLNQLTRQVNTEIDRYKSLATEYKSLALQEQSLVESLDHPTAIDSSSPK
jgi:chromosome segregation ATPase